MFATPVRLALRRRVIHHPHCPPDEAKALSATVVRILHDYRELTADDLWEHAKRQGIRSRTHLTQLLKWLQQENVLDTSDSLVYRIRGEESRNAADKLRLAELALENIRIRDTRAVTMTDNEIRRKEYEERPLLRRPLTFWDL